jgi:hypothetical protein
MGKSGTRRGVTAAPPVTRDAFGKTNTVVSFKNHCCPGQFRAQFFSLLPPVAALLSGESFPNGRKMLCSSGMREHMSMRDLTSKLAQKSTQLPARHTDGNRYPSYFLRVTDGPRSRIEFGTSFQRGDGDG